MMRLMFSVSETFWWQ